MKLWIKSACAAFVLCVIYSLVPFQADCQSISREVFRLHILANSDSEEDQALKLKVRDRILQYSAGLFESAQSIDEAQAAAEAHLGDFERIAADELRRCGSNHTVRAELADMYFSTRKYDGFTLPAGCYSAIRLTIGEGRGHNWWCVMFPSLCVTRESSDQKARDAFSDSEYKVVSGGGQEYKFFVVEMFERLFG